ncbi:hypothetical protein E2C01_032489 [Portunus trituberculatus]|uniref:Uncharacterized protein n=1 Tax=Portunus trituberculatus TaxID=210409 RepID=A0A5B7EVE3_PORTR|nr:hypothetical protein [Portunus trituberculatus]
MILKGGEDSSLNPYGTPSPSSFPPNVPPWPQRNQRNASPHELRNKEGGRRRLGPAPCTPTLPGWRDSAGCKTHDPPRHMRTLLSDASNYSDKVNKVHQQT